MAVHEILALPDPLLREKARSVTRFDDELKRLIDDMFETMYAAPGIGLAAPQIGRNLRLFVYDLQEGEGAPRHRGVMVNPEFVSKEGEQTDEEGCLSVEDYRAKVTRAQRVVVRGLDSDGAPITLEGESLMARMLQHEIDHLEGRLFVDRLSPLKRSLYLKRLKKRIRADGHE